MYSTIIKMVNIDKAKRLLGYWPIFTMQESLDRSVAWWMGGRGEEDTIRITRRIFDRDPQAQERVRKDGR
jgi:hypothetical protein